MTKILCDAMDCTLITPIGKSVEDKPNLGYCQRNLVNIAKHGDRPNRPTCITYREKDTRQRSGE